MKKSLLILSALCYAAMGWAQISNTTVAPSNMMRYKNTVKLVSPTGAWGSGIRVNAFNTFIVSHDFLEWGRGTITFASNVTSMGDTAFYKCYFEEIELPKTLQSIGKQAFAQCRFLSSVTLPQSVSYIDEKAFANCQDLTNVTCMNSTPPALGANCFENSPVSYIFVPKSSVSTYKAAAGWSAYSDKIRAITDKQLFYVGHEYIVTEATDFSKIEQDLKNQGLITDGTIRFTYNKDGYSTLELDGVTFSASLRNSALSTFIPMKIVLWNMNKIPAIYNGEAGPFESLYLNDSTQICGPGYLQLSSIKIDDNLLRISDCTLDFDQDANNKLSTIQPNEFSSYSWIFLNNTELRFKKDNAHNPIGRFWRFRAKHIDLGSGNYWSNGSGIYTSTASPVRGPYTIQRKVGSTQYFTVCDVPFGNKNWSALDELMGTISYSGTLRFDSLENSLTMHNLGIHIPQEEGAFIGTNALAEIVVKGNNYIQTANPEVCITLAGGTKITGESKTQVSDNKLTLARGISLDATPSTIEDITLRIGWDQTMADVPEFLNGIHGNGYYTSSVVLNHCELWINASEDGGIDYMGGVTTQNMHLEKPATLVYNAAKHGMSENGADVLYKGIIHYTPTLVSAVPSVLMDGTQEGSKKYIRDGQLYIIRQGKVYNAQGAVVE